MEFNPVEHFVQQLQARFAHIASFAVNAVEGRTIGVHWRRTRQQGGPLNLSAAHLHSAAAVHGEAREGCVTKGSALADMCSLGVGIVARVFYKEQPAEHSQLSMET